MKKEKSLQPTTIHLRPLLDIKIIIELKKSNYFSRSRSPSPLNLIQTESDQQKEELAATKAIFSLFPPQLILF
jgi:hypothetical protein